MTIDEIEYTLPNGFHDSRIITISVDYAKRVAKFDLEISFSDTDQPGVESYRRATLSLSRLLYCVIEAPDPTYPFQVERPLWVDGGSAESEEVSRTRLPKPLPDNAFTYWFFVNDWNSFIHVAACDANILLD